MKSGFLLVLVLVITCAGCGGIESGAAMTWRDAVTALLLAAALFVAFRREGA